MGVEDRMAQARRERQTEARVRAMDASDLVSLIHEHEDAEQRLEGDLETKDSEIDELEARVKELERIFRLQHDAQMRAVSRWRDANPGNELVLPDHADLVVWLLDRDAEAGRIAEDGFEKIIKAVEGRASASPRLLSQIEEDARFALQRIAALTNSTGSVVDHEAAELIDNGASRSPMSHNDSTGSDRGPPTPFGEGAARAAAEAREVLTELEAHGELHADFGLIRSALHTACALDSTGSEPDPELVRSAHLAALEDELLADFHPADGQRLVLSLVRRAYHIGAGSEPGETRDGQAPAAEAHAEPENDGELVACFRLVPPTDERASEDVCASRYEDGEEAAWRIRDAWKMATEHLTPTEVLEAIQPDEQDCEAMAEWLRRGEPERASEKCETCGGKGVHDDYFGDPMSCLDCPPDTPALTERERIINEAAAKAMRAVEASINRRTGWLDSLSLRDRANALDGGEG